MSGVIVRGWQARLYPTPEQIVRLNQWAGSLRFLWNRLLEREKSEFDACGKFIWRKALQPIALGLKRSEGLEWLADLPAHAVLDTVARMDGALRRMVKERKAGRDCGFPKRKKKFVNEAGVYCVGQATAISAGEVTLPKLGIVKASGGTVPQGRLLASRIWRDGDLVDAVGAVPVRPSRAAGAIRRHRGHRPWRVHIGHRFRWRGISGMGRA